MAVYISIYASVETRDRNISYSNIGVVSTTHSYEVTFSHVYHMHYSNVL